MFTRPNEDLALSGPITLALLRSFAQSRRKVDVGMGWGWTHSLAWSIVERRTEVVVREPFGATVSFDKTELHRGAFGAGGWTLYREPNGGYRLHALDDLTHTFEGVGDERHYRLTSVEHASRNKVALVYDARGALATIVDFAGRTIDVATDGQCRIVRLSVTNPRTLEQIVFARYQYTDSGDLARYVDADGHATSYAYDDDHRITRYSHPNGLTFHFVYDKQHRCVESWGDYQGRTDPALDPELPTFLADGETRARGIFHVRLNFSADGYSEVMDSVRLTRFFADPDTGKISKGVGGDGGVTSRSFDYVGNVAAKSDAESATTTYQWDPFGRLVAESDAIGRTFRIERDPWGRVVKNVDFDGSTVEVLRDRYGNAEHITGKQGELTTYKFDDRSILREELGPDGGRTRYESDEHGNMTAAVLPDGSTYRWEWDPHRRARIGWAHGHPHGQHSDLLRPHRAELARVGGDELHRGPAAQFADAPRRRLSSVPALPPRHAGVRGAAWLQGGVQLAGQQQGLVRRAHCIEEPRDPRARTGHWERRMG